MSLASRITDLVTALATALNARSQVGASDYQQWLAQGNSGTIDNYRASILGADMDFAARFQTALGAAPTVVTATEARAGITQLATLAEVLAGTNSAKAVSAANSVGARIATSLADLNTKAAALPSGSILALPLLDTGNGLLYRSIWYVNQGVAQPVLPLVASAATVLTYLPTVIGTGKTNANLQFDAGISEALVGTGSATGFRTRYVWNSTAFAVVADARMQAMGYQSAAQAMQANTLNAFAVSNVVSDPTGLMAPPSGNNSAWSAPWVGRYRFTMTLTIDQNVPQGSYAGITVYQTKPGGAQNNVGDNGYRMLWSAGDALRFASDFYVDTAGSLLQAFLYAQAAAAFNTGAGSDFTIRNPKTPRLSLEYLGA